MKNRLCFEIKHGSFPIMLTQQGKNSFTVVYGRQVDSDLSYTTAARKLGESIMHKLGCDGKLDDGGMEVKR